MERQLECQEKIWNYEAFPFGDVVPPLLTAWDKGQSQHYQQFTQTRKRHYARGEQIPGTR
jgi:hypothetical protein